MKDDLPPLPNFIETDLCAAMQEWAETEPGDDAEAAFALVVKWFGIELQAYAKAHNAKLEAQVERLRSALDRLLDSYTLMLAGKPVRDVSETLAETNAALKL